MTGVGHEDSSLAAQCLAICQTLTNQGKAFSMSINVGPNFSFSWNTKSMEAPPSRAKKKASRSTLRRNKRRREEFLKKKYTSMSLENVDSDKDASQIATFSCDECQHVSKTDKGLKDPQRQNTQVCQEPAKIINRPPSRSVSNQGSWKAPAM